MSTNIPPELKRRLEEANKMAANLPEEERRILAQQVMSEYRDEARHDFSNQRTFERSFVSRDVPYFSKEIAVEEDDAEPEGIPEVGYDVPLEVSGCAEYALQIEGHGDDPKKNFVDEICDREESPAVKRAQNRAFRKALRELKNKPKLQRYLMRMRKRIERDPTQQSEKPRTEEERLWLFRATKILKNTNWFVEG